MLDDLEPTRVVSAAQRAAAASPSGAAMTAPSPIDDGDLADIVAAVAREDRPAAASLAKAALGRGLEHPLVLVLVAEALETEGDPSQAAALLQKAAALAPDGLEVWRRLGRLLAAQGMQTEAAAAFDQALAIAPTALPILLDAGVASFRSGDLKTAEDRYRRAAELAPHEAEPLAALAAIAARKGDVAQARVQAERALRLQPDSISAHMAIGRADLSDGAADRAEVRMSELLGRSDLNHDSRVGALDLRAEALDRLDRAADAFADYTARNSILERLHAPRMANERRIDQARRLNAYFARAPAQPWRRPAGRDEEGARAARGHVFLLGFPRSGTTLLEKALAGHSDVVTLDEVDHLIEIADPLLDEVEDLARLSPEAADAHRQVYWRGVRETVGESLPGKVVVDKMPLHTAALPVIAKLFPDARILFAVRDPRDVALSCFRRRFQINAAMFEFLTLDGAARYYDQVMALAKIYRGLLPLAVHEVRYESMVADFDQQMRRVLGFIGLDWDQNVAGFAERAAAAPRTPSGPQLARGLNTDGVAQWRRYERQMAPVAGLLEPWASHFGYPPAGSSVDAAVKSWGFGFRVVHRPLWRG